MSYRRIHQQQDRTAELACIYLRNKAMVVTGQPNPNRAEEAENDSCWCNQTQHVFGPDQELVERSTCIPGRACFRAFR